MTTFEEVIAQDRVTVKLLGIKEKRGMKHYHISATQDHFTGFFIITGPLPVVNKILQDLEDEIEACGIRKIIERLEKQERGLEND